MVFPGYAGGSSCGEDLLLVDFDSPASIRPGKASPTVVEWDADPRAWHYDLIRGDVADLAFGAGNTVDLGAVTCLENDTRNTSNAGADADTDQPAPGQTFFFVHRITRGEGLAPAGYGNASSGAERVPASGGCSP